MSIDHLCPPPLSGPRGLYHLRGHREKSRHGVGGCHTLHRQICIGPGSPVITNKDGVTSANQRTLFWWADQWEARRDWHLGDAALITVITLTMGWCRKGELWREKLPPEKVKVGTGFMSEVVCRVTRQMLSRNETFITRRGQNIRRGAREKHCHWSLGHSASVSSSPCSLWRHWALAWVLVSALIWIICPGMSTADAGARRKFWRKMSHKDV